MRGRPRTPNALKLARGTFRPDRANPQEPRPPVGIPSPRRGLSRLARVEYHRLTDALGGLRVVTHADAIALELCAQALAQHRVAVDVLLRDGQSYESVTAAGATMRRPRPEVATAADSWRRAATMLQQFGLTPASRAKVSSQPDPVGELLGLTGGRLGS
jgi:P27 family predicted phage terminase small subunit